MIKWCVTRVSSNSNLAPGGNYTSLPSGQKGLQSGSCWKCSTDENGRIKHYEVAGNRGKKIKKIPAVLSLRPVRARKEAFKWSCINLFEWSQIYAPLWKFSVLWRVTTCSPSLYSCLTIVITKYYIGKHSHELCGGVWHGIFKNPILQYLLEITIKKKYQGNKTKFRWKDLQPSICTGHTK